MSTPGWAKVTGFARIRAQTLAESNGAFGPLVNAFFDPIALSLTNGGIAVSGQDLELTLSTPRSFVQQYTFHGTISTPFQGYGAFTRGGSNPTLTIQDGAIGLAGQTLALSLAVPLSAGSVTVAGQSVTLAASLPLSNGSVTVAGQSISAALSLPLSAGSVTVAGQSVGFTQALPIGGGALSLTGQTIALYLSGALSLVIDAPGAITVTGQDITLAVSGGTVEQPSGGFISSYDLWRAHSQRRRKQLQDDEEQALEQTSADAAAQEIARFLHEQAKRDAQRDELARLRALVLSQPLPDELNEKAREAFRLAQEKKTTGAMLALSRAIIRQQEEEHFLITAALMFDE